MSREASSRISVHVHQRLAESGPLNDKVDQFETDSFRHRSTVSSCYVLLVSYMDATSIPSIVVKKENKLFTYLEDPTKKQRTFQYIRSPRYEKCSSMAGKLLNGIWKNILGGREADIMHPFSSRIIISKCTIYQFLLQGFKNRNRNCSAPSFYSMSSSSLHHLSFLVISFLSHFFSSFSPIPCAV